jgi:hypothetical protein
MMTCPPSLAGRPASLARYGLLASVALTLAGAANGRAVAQEAALATSSAADIDTAPTCTMTDTRLSGAVYDASRPERSFALVQHRAGQRGEVYRAGMSIGVYELVAIEPRGVLLRSADGECWLRLVGSPERALRASAPPPRKKKRARKTDKAKSEVVVIGRRR